MQQSRQSWPSVVVALGFLALVGWLAYLAVENDFEKVWAGVGTIVGVVTGAIPAVFFRQQAQNAEIQRQQASAEAQKAALRAHALSEVADTSVVNEARTRYPEAF